MGRSLFKCFTIRAYPDSSAQLRQMQSLMLPELCAWTLVIIARFTGYWTVKERGTALQ